jgi:hypothetical protein
MTLSQGPQAGGGLETQPPQQPKWEWQGPRLGEPARSWPYWTTDVFNTGRRARRRRDRHADCGGVLSWQMKANPCSWLNNSTRCLGLDGAQWRKRAHLLGSKGIHTPVNLDKLVMHE